ncbi:MAG: DUF692 family protein [Myxococcota bacterium]
MSCGAASASAGAETAWLIQQRTDLAFTEVVAEAFRGRPRPRAAARQQRRRGGATGDARPRRRRAPDRGRLRRLAATARAYGSPLVSEHVAFVRGGGRESGHLLPVPRTEAALAVLVRNVRIAQDALPVPLALENIAAPLGWPDDDLSDAAFLAALVAETGVQLVLDLANLHANARNRGVDPGRSWRRCRCRPWRTLHVAGGVRCGPWYHDTHAHPVPARAARAAAPGAGARGGRAGAAERDRGFTGLAALEAEPTRWPRPRRRRSARRGAIRRRRRCGAGRSRLARCAPGRARGAARRGRAGSAGLRPGGAGRHGAHAGRQGRARVGQPASSPRSC